MVLDEIRVGPIVATDGTVQVARSDKTGAQVVTDGHARYQEAVLRGNVFLASNQAGVALTVGISTTSTGLALSNPPNSGKNLVILDLIIAPTTAPAGIATIGIEAVVVPTAVDSTHTTPLTPRNALVGNTSTPVGKTDTAATLAATPIAIRAVPGGPVATGGISTPFIRDEIAGAIILAPGTALSLFCLTTAISVLATIVWEEVAV